MPTCTKTMHVTTYSKILVTIFPLYDSLRLDASLLKAIVVLLVVEVLLLISTKHFRSSEICIFTLQEEGNVYLKNTQ